MNRSIITSIGVTFFLILSSCYHNGHVRSQRILEPGDRIISPEISVNALSSGRNGWQSQGIDDACMAGVRAGISYLGLHGRFEQGGYIGYGFSDESGIMILGYDLRKVKYLTSGTPIRYGLYLEGNFISKGNASYGIYQSKVFQIRPSITTVSSPQKPFYSGVHALLNIGNASNNFEEDFIYDPVSSTYIYNFNSIDYQILSPGLGLSTGYEGKFLDFLTQIQADISWVNQRHEVLNRSSNPILYQEDMKKDGLVVTIGLSIHKAPASERKRRAKPLISRALRSPVVQETPPRKALAKFDPDTGLPIQEAQTGSSQKFDPNTGLKIPETTPIFDPKTGLPVIKNAKQHEAKVPLSLLTAEEQMNLALSTLKVSKYNGVMADANVIDITVKGLVVQQVNSQKVDTLHYPVISTIEFSGKKQGFPGCVRGGLTACGVCYGLPLAATFVFSDLQIFDIVGGMVPLAVLGGMVLGGNKPYQTEVDFRQIPISQTGNDYKQELLLGLIQRTLSDGLQDEKIAPVLPALRP